MSKLALTPVKRSGDLVLLTLGQDNMTEIAGRVKASGYKASIFMAAKDDPKAVRFLNELAGIALSERISETECVVTARCEDWTEVLQCSRIKAARSN